MQLYVQLGLTVCCILYQFTSLLIHNTIVPLYLDLYVKTVFNYGLKRLQSNRTILVIVYTYNAFCKKEHTKGLESFSLLPPKSWNLSNLRAYCFDFLWCRNRGCCWCVLCTHVLKHACVLHACFRPAEKKTYYAIILMMIDDV